MSHKTFWEKTAREDTIAKVCFSNLFPFHAVFRPEEINLPPKFNYKTPWNKTPHEFQKELIREVPFGDIPIRADLWNEWLLTTCKEIRKVDEETEAPQSADLRSEPVRRIEEETGVPLNVDVKSWLVYLIETKCDTHTIFAVPKYDFTKAERNDILKQIKESLKVQKDKQTYQYRRFGESSAWGHFLSYENVLKEQPRGHFSEALSQKIENDLIWNAYENVYPDHKLDKRERRIKGFRDDCRFIRKLIEASYPIFGAFEIRRKA